MFLWNYLLLVCRVMKMKSKVFLGIHLGLCLPHAVETNLFGFGKCSPGMSMSSFQCCKGILRMLKWFNGIRPWIYCSLAAMIIPLRCKYIFLCIIFVFHLPRQKPLELVVCCFLKLFMFILFLFFLFICFYNSGHMELRLNNDDLSCLLYIHRFGQRTVTVMIGIVFKL